MVDNPFSPEVKAYEKRRDELEMMSFDDLVKLILKKEGHKIPEY